MTVRNCSILVILGFVLSVLSSLVGGLRLFSLDIYLCNFAFIALAALYPCERTNKTVATAWCLATGAVLHGAVFLGLKHENDISAWSALALSLLVLFVYLVLKYFSIIKLKPLHEVRVSGLDTKTIAVLAFIAALTIVMFRALDAMLVDIPNEQRSILLFGVEFHHINFGVILLLIMDMLGYARRQGKYMLGLFVAGVGLGMLIDQSVYFALEQITDDSYRSATSLWGAIAVYVTCIATWFWHEKRTLVLP